MREAGQMWRRNMGKSILLSSLTHCFKKDKNRYCKIYDKWFWYEASRAEIAGLGGNCGEMEKPYSIQRDPCHRAGAPMLLDFKLSREAEIWIFMWNLWIFHFWQWMQKEIFLNARRAQMVEAKWRYSVWVPRLSLRVHVCDHRPSERDRVGGAYGRVLTGR